MSLLINDSSVLNLKKTRRKLCVLAAGHGFVELEDESRLFSAQAQMQMIQLG